MKKILTALAITVLTSTSALAHGWEHGGYRGGHSHYETHYHGSGYDWVAPALIGGIVGYELAQPRVIVQQPPVVYTQPQVIYTRPATSVPYGYHYESILDANCNCYRNVLVQN